MAYEIGVKSSFWPKQFLPITKYDILNLVFTDSGCFKFWRLHEYFCPNKPGSTPSTSWIFCFTFFAILYYRITA